jgi:ABC-type polysaccharide/polyol phosphate transport system ATPase subunit
MSQVIHTENLSKLYKIYNSPADRLKELFPWSKKALHREFWALKDVSLSIAPGETVGIVGRNGSGKTTLLKIISGVLQPSSGLRSVNGRVASLLELGTGFNPELTGRENIFINGAIQGFSRREMNKRFEEIVAFAELADFIDVPVKKYSSGMYVRLAFSCAINVDPDVLIVDEALSVGDELFQRKCFLKLEAFQKQGKTILFVSHSSSIVKQLCSRAILLEHGAIHTQGSPNDVINEYTRLLFGSPKVAAQAPVVELAKDAAATKEYRYGSEGAEISEIGVVDNAGRSMEALECGAQVSVRFKVRFDKSIAQPIYALTIKNAQGLEIYGTNTWFKGLPFEGRTTGDIVEVEFTQRLNLVGGTYYLSLGCVALEGTELVPLDRRYDCMVLKVLPIDRDFGVAYLDSEVTVTQAPVAQSPNSALSMGE